MARDPRHPPIARERIREHLAGCGLLRARELAELGAHRATLERLVAAGLVEKVSRGLYRLVGAEPLPREDLAVVAARVPRAVIGMVTALDLHGLTTEIDGVSIRITSPAKTVADCFKYRRRVGWDVAMEGLETGLRTRAFTPAEVLEMARVDRVATLVRPHVGSLA